MRTFYPKNKATYKWFLLVKGFYYSFVIIVVSEILFEVIPALVMPGKSLHWRGEPAIIFLLYSYVLIGSFMIMDGSYGTKVKSISIDESNRMVIIRYKILLFFHKEKRISFDDFEYAFNGCTGYTLKDKIIRLFIPYCPSDLRILDKKQHKIFFQATYGWTIEQVSEIADCFSQIKSPKDFDEVAPW